MDISRTTKAGKKFEWTSKIMSFYTYHHLNIKEL